jgi:hypothetical protein
MLKGFLLVFFLIKKTLTENNEKNLINFDFFF